MGEGAVGEGARDKGGREKGEGRGEAESDPLRRRARGLPAGKGRAGAAVREGPLLRTGQLSEGAGKEGEGEPKSADG